MTFHVVPEGPYTCCPVVEVSIPRQAAGDAMAALLHPFTDG